MAIRFRRARMEARAAATGGNFTLQCNTLITTNALPLGLQ